MDHSGRALARNAGIVSAATFISRVFGLLRDLTFAFVLGSTPVADAFIVAFRLPNLLRRLFAEGSLTMAVIPVFARLQATRGREAAFEVGRSVQVWLVLLLSVFIGAAIFFAVPLTRIIAPGFSAKDPAVLELTAHLVRICFPYILFISSAALCMGMLNSLGRFFIPSLTPALLNIVLILFALAGFTTGGSVPVWLAWGVFTGGVAQWLMQLPQLSAMKFTYFRPFRLITSEVKTIGRMMLPTIFGSAVYQINILLVSTVLASLLPFGSISYLFYADRLVQFPLGVFGIAISTAALPSLSHLIATQEEERFRKTLETSIKLSMFIALPASAGLIALSNPIITLLFERGAFTSAATLATAQALVAYTVGLPAASCIRTLASGFYALEDTRTPVIVATATMILNILLALLLMRPLSHNGLALAVSLSAWFNLVWLGILLRRRIGCWFNFGGLGKVLLASLIVFLLAWATRSRPALALCLIPLWATGYIWVLHAWGVREASLVVDMLSSFRRRKHQVSGRGGV